MEQIQKESDETSGEIASLLEMGTYHSGGGVEEDGLEDENVYIDLGED